MEGMIGVSPAMREVQKLIGRVADGKTTILITGETGAGKEVVARAIHRFGDRASKPFVALNCAAIPAELMESELFGHVKGAFTGAASDRAGAFADANGGERPCPCCGGRMRVVEVFARGGGPSAKRDPSSRASQRRWS